MTTIAKRRRYPTGDSTVESDDENAQMSNGTSQATSQRRMSFTNDLASGRLIVSERRQLAVLKQLTASDEPGRKGIEQVFRKSLFVSLKGISPSSSTTVIPQQQQQRSTKVFRRNEHGETIVHVAARKGDLKRLKKALKDGANVNEEDNAGKTIMEIDIFSSDKPSLSRLLGWTPLHEGNSFFKTNSNKHAFLVF